MKGLETIAIEDKARWYRCTLSFTMPDRCQYQLCCKDEAGGEDVQVCSVDWDKMDMGDDYYICSYKSTRFVTWVLTEK